MEIFASTVLAVAIWAIKQAITLKLEINRSQKEYYQNIASGLIAITIPHYDLSKIESLLETERLLWIYGSDDVIKAFGDLVEALKPEYGQAEKEVAVSKLIRAMRRDVHSFWRVIFRRTKLSAEDFKLRAVTSLGEGAGFPSARNIDAPSTC